MALSLANPFVVEHHNLWTNPNGPRSTTAYIVVHHAAATYRPGQAVADIYKYHSKKWPDYHAAAYHEILQIEADGNTIGCHIVNDPRLIGAGVFDHNGDTFHICAAANFIGVPDDAFIEALAQRCAAAKLRYPAAQIVGHKDIARPGHATSCPGPLWIAWKVRLLSRVQALLNPAAVRYKVRGVPVFQRQDCTGPIVDFLDPGRQIEIDKTYPDGTAHLASGAGFVRLDEVERL